MGAAESPSLTWMVVSRRLAMGDCVQLAGAMAKRSELVKHVSSVRADWLCSASLGSGSR
jgi:hypothetical protein